MLVISNRPSALKSLAQLLPELYSTKSYYHYLLLIIIIIIIIIGYEALQDIKPFHHKFLCSSTH